MNTIKNNKFNAKSIIPFLITLILIITAYQGFYRFGFSSDTITHYLNPMINIDARFTYGRYIPYLLELSCYKLGIILPDHYKTFYMMFIVVTACAAYLYQQAIMSLLQRKMIFLTTFEEYMGRAALTLPFVSTLFSEYFMFPECFFFCFGFLFSAIAVNYYAGKKYLKAVIYLLLAAFTYQTAVILCAIYVILYIVIYGDFVLNIKTLSRGLITSFCCLFAGLINFLTTKLMLALGVMTDTPKPLEIGSLLDSILGIIRIFIGFIKDGSGLLPVPLANLLVIVISLGLMASELMTGSNRPNNDSGTVHKRILTLIFAGFIMFCLALAIPLVQSQAPRVIFVMYAAMACSCFLAYVQVGPEKKKIMQVVIAAILMLQIFACQQIAVNHYISNTEDIACARAVLNKIADYEDETGITVEEIAVCEDGHSSNYYDDVHYTLWQINERVAHNVAYSLLEYVNNPEAGASEKRFKKSKMSPDKIRKKYFADMDWDSFNVDQQLIIDGSTAYWCIY